MFAVSTYVLLESNCQTLANLLAQRIALGSDPLVPYQTISHYLGGGLSRKNLYAVNEFDQARSTKLNSILLRESRYPTTHSSEGALAGARRPSYENQLGNAIDGGIAEDELIDLEGANRQNCPLNVSEVRSNARFWSRDPTSPGPDFAQPPPFSLPEGYTEWAKSRGDKPNLERFPGPDSPYTKWVKDESRNFFSRQVEYQRDVRAREEEMKLWDNSDIPEETRAKVYAELAMKENQWVRKVRVARSASRIAHTTDSQDPEMSQGRADNWYDEVD